jgi:hypothetical protein
MCLLRETTALGFPDDPPGDTEAEANNNEWPIQRHIDGTVCVDMCLQCQMARSDRQKRPR